MPAYCSRQLLGFAQFKRVLQIPNELAQRRIESEVIACTRVLSTTSLCGGQLCRFSEFQGVVVAVP